MNGRYFKCPRADYHVIGENGKLDTKHNKNACFSYLFYRKEKNGYQDAHVKKIKYYTTIDKKLTNEEVLFYLAFLNKLFGKDAFTFKRRGIDIIFYVKNEKMMKTLVILTGLRYLTECNEIIKETYIFYKTLNEPQTEESFEKLFQYFQEMHFLQCRSFGIFSGKRIVYENISGHGLVHCRSWYNNDEKKEFPGGISFKKFTERFNSKENFPRVQAYFIP